MSSNSSSRGSIEEPAVVNGNAGYRPRKKPRSEHSNNDESLLEFVSLPDDALRSVLSYSAPNVDHQRWEWAGIVRQTCKGLHRFASEITPSAMQLGDFARYESVVRPGKLVDARGKILQALSEVRWMAESLTEFHVNWMGVVSIVNERPYKYRARYKAREGEDSIVVADLFSLLMTPSSLPNLKWLDVAACSSDYVLGIVIENDLLTLLPSALPSVTKLTLVGLRGRYKGALISPSQSELFIAQLHSTLTSLSLIHFPGMSDCVVAAILPLIGSNLKCLELSGFNLTDGAMRVIARECQNLRSLSITDSRITVLGLSNVLSANKNIVRLNLSDNKSLGRETMDVIVRHTPQLQELRNCTWLRDYMYEKETDWLVGGLDSLIDEQLRRSGGSEISLRTIAIAKRTSLATDVNVASLRRALERGLKIVEAELYTTTVRPSSWNTPDGVIIRALASDFPRCSFVDYTYTVHVDGSECNYPYQGPYTTR
mmetsp:Transcript_22223/g.46016  ORF Transcript_22223/g.46016 Transcript_22223/m.46016 type:complete len:485 (-) Transcript_22223:724-2178(-)